MKNYKIGILIAMILTLASCKKETGSGILMGDYTGQLIATNNNPAANSIPFIGDVAISLKSNRTFISQYNSLSIGAGGHGSFTIAHPDIVFRDSTVHTANFDWGLILNGSYAYTVKGDSLTLIKNVSYMVYTYRLKLMTNGQ